MELRCPQLPATKQLFVLVPLPPVKPDRNSGQQGTEVRVPVLGSVIPSLLGLRVFRGKADHWGEGMETKHWEGVRGRQAGERTRGSDIRQGDEE